MIRYYNPFLYLSTILKACLINDQEFRITNFFKDYTNKKYILITSSCRSALYLTYKSLNDIKLVATSPLTCFSAIQPILLAEKEIEFIDIDSKTLNMDLNLLSEKNLQRIDAIQIIHHGGLPIDYLAIKEKIKSNNIIIIEDCAQSFGAYYSGYNIGSEADVSCFSLAKNLFGVGGGILATNNYDIFKRAKEYQQRFEQISFFLIIYRIFRNCLATYSSKKFIALCLSFILNLRNSPNTQNNIEINKKYYCRPNKIQLKISAIQLSYVFRLLENQKNNAFTIYENLKRDNLILNDQSSLSSSFTKFFVYFPAFKADLLNCQLNKNGIESKHLEDKYKSTLQISFDKLDYLRYNKSLYKCKNYFKVHDSLISLPVRPDSTSIELARIIQTIKKNYNSNN